VTELLQFTLFGLMLGCIYAIAAMGLVLTYNVTGVFNFAHGAVGMIAAFLYFELRFQHGVPTPLALLFVVGVFAPAAGVVAERLLRRFQHADPSTSLVVTIALTVALLGISQKVFDPREPRVIPSLFGNHRINLFSVPITYDRLSHVVTAIAVAFGLRFLLFGTRLGSRMRAVVDDRELARLRGVRSVLVARCGWMIGFALAALGGILFSGGQNLNAIVLTLLVLNAYGAAMVGRLTSLPMTFVGALLLGLCQELTNVSWLWPDSEVFSRLKVAIPGIFLIGAILLVPSFRLSAGRVVGRDQPPTPTVRRASLASSVLIAFVALRSYDLLLVGGFFLGIAGTAFAVGVPFVNAWFPPERRGLAIGIFGAGMGGTAISALTTVKLTNGLGARAPFLITAGVLAVYAAAAWLILRDAPGRVAPTTSLVSRISANSRLPITWQASLLYAVAFGGYVAFSVYLPAYLKTAHQLTPADAANRMAGFVLVAVIMRPVGGWLADRLGAIPVLAAGFGVVVVGAGISAGTPPLEGIGTMAFLAMAAALGSGSGATFALIARVTESTRVGGVTGLVGAAGGLGGFVPPLLMGYVYGRTDSYAIGLWLLALTAASALALTLTIVRRTAAREEVR